MPRYLVWLGTSTSSPGQCACLGTAAFHRLDPRSARSTKAASNRGWRPVGSTQEGDYRTGNDREKTGLTIGKLFLQDLLHIQLIAGHVAVAGEEKAAVGGKGQPFDLRVQ